MSSRSPDDEAALIRLAAALIDQPRARIIVHPNQPASGFWFGGGNLTQTPDDALLLVGRYRDAGDSRTGIQAGQRGRELAILRAASPDAPFEKIASFQKSDLDHSSCQVLSIEGAALRVAPDGACELFVSTEKDGIGYPDSLADYLKPGTGVWTIDRLAAPSLDALPSAQVEPFLASTEPGHLHVKDPFLYTSPAGSRFLGFCTHPFNWSSSNSAYLPLDTPPEFENARLEFLPRGPAWDVAITRATCLLDVPAVGRFRDRAATLVFYDGGESLRNLDEHARAVSRPRGYSCEELGGLACFTDTAIDDPHRLSAHHPLFVSPHGTGCSRYVDVLRTARGDLIATWQQSQPDGSQPLVMNMLTADEIADLLS